MVAQIHKKTIVNWNFWHFLLCIDPKPKQNSQLSWLTTHNSHLFRIIMKKSKSREFLGAVFLFKWYKILIHSGFSKKILTLKVCKPMKGMKVTWWYHKVFWSFSWTSCYNNYIAFIWTSNYWIVWKCFK